MSTAKTITASGQLTIPRRAKEQVAARVALAPQGTRVKVHMALPTMLRRLSPFYGNGRETNPAIRAALGIL